MQRNFHLETTDNDVQGSDGSTSATESIEPNTTRESMCAPIKSDYAIAQNEVQVSEAV